MRVDLLVRAGAFEENQRERAYTLAQRGRVEMDARTQRREPTPLADLRRQTDKRVREASDQPVRSELRAVVVDEHGRRVAVLDKGRHLTTVPTNQGDLELGHQYEAESRHEREGERRRVLAWRFEDLERAREREHDRGR